MKRRNGDCETNTPAKRVIERFGGIREVARVLGLSESRVYRWTLPRARGGTDGMIPTKHLPVLLRVARARGIALTAADLVECDSQ